MININFNLDKKDRLTPIISVLRYSGNVVRISMSSMGVPKVLPKNWNPNKQKAKGDGSATINHYLDKFIRITKASFHALNLESGIPDTKTLKETIRERYAGIEIKQEVTLNSYMEKFIEDSRVNKAAGTTKTYVTTKNAVLAYQAHCKKEHDFKDVDLQYCLDFERYLLGTDKSPNYTHKLIRILKTMLKDAYNKGENKYRHFEKSDFKAKKTPSREHVVLSIAELTKIHSLELEGKTDNIRDMFLIGCHTGLRISDYSKLLEENIYKENGKEFVKIRTKKTMEDVIIPINPTVRSILRKRNGKLPKVYSDQEFNRSIKKLGEMAGLDERITRTEHKGNNRLLHTYHKYELISSHTARRSFATNAVLEGVPYHWIMQITGHRSVKSFEKYVKISAKKAAILLANHTFFNKPVLRVV